MKHQIQLRHLADAFRTGRFPTTRFNIAAFATICTIAIAGILPGSPVIAGYTPPQGNPPEGPTVANGSRGACSNDSSLPLTVLAPLSHVGQSSTSMPTLAWFVPATNPYRVSISLYRPQADGRLEQIYLEEKEEQTSGILRATLPTAEILEMGQRYYWEVAIACDPQSPTYDQTFTATIDLVAPSPELAAKLADATTSQDRLAIYAAEGYWYDALREATDTQLGTLLSDLASLETDHQRSFLEQIATGSGFTDQ